jgi:hypothetical protein
MKRTYLIAWTKTYVASGEVNIVADSLNEAMLRAESNLGDYEGSLNWIPDDSTLEPVEDSAEVISWAKGVIQ